MASMSDLETQRQFAKRLFVPKVLWVAFVMAHILFAGAFWMARRAEAEGQPEMLRYILAGMGTVLAMGAPIVRGIFKGKVGPTLKDHDPGTLVQAFFAPMLLSFALAETGAVLGGVVLLLGFEPLYWAIPAAVGFLVHLTLFPSQDKLEVWREELRGRR